ncbi:MAG: hypothetical protein E7610_05000 [Ruminococcaceae bacterium]|nr:hypothetical protein [Oscillospiraceae bacterium]
MPIRRKRESRVQRRYARGSTKKGFILRRPAHLGKILGGIGAAAAVILLALVWGSYLKVKSDAYREAQERGEWTLEEEEIPAYPVPVPAVRSVSIKPEGNVGDILIAGSHGGVMMNLTPGDAPLPYTSAVAQRAGLAVAADAVSLTKDVARVQKRGLYVTCVFTVTCFSEENIPLRNYVRGLELALLREYAEAGMNDLLLMGLPNGTEAADQLTRDFLRDLKILLGDLPVPPAVGVMLPPGAFASVSGEEFEPPYVGNMTPARILGACDYLVADLRGIPVESLSDTLSDIRYVYVRYSLRLMVDKNTPAAAKEAISHGFGRVFEGSF